MEVSKYISSQVVEINRSEIMPANYNPRKISDKSRKLLKDNIKRLGVMGGIVWNELTHNLVGGHQKLNILDELHKYDAEKQKNDYVLRVEKVQLSSKEEIEQNIFLNNKNAQGEFDQDLLDDILPDIDLKFAGLEDLNLDVDFGEPEPLDSSGSSEPKEDGINNSDEGDNYVMLSFNDNESKIKFMQRFDLEESLTIIDGDDFNERIERID
ncbi:DNA methylase [Sphingobacterium sp. 1.A.4]|uniref:DNA methylase n=1 Tax=Sphingobacterium sp. 1.A.4 TaxID=2044603 RepID=UPI000C0BCE8B|nr:DNA methylase [Sphingobacterium sp. 1.A.4]